MPRRALLLTLVTAIAAPAALAAEGAAAVEGVVESIFARTSGTPMPGGAVVVLRDGKVVLSRAHGLARIETAEANTTRTRFRLASVSKSFTALLVLQLVEKGRLGLDDSVTKYVPGVGGGVRVRHVLSHTAGLPDFVSVEDALKLPLDGAPGERLNYSNVGYALLARVIEKASGRPYEAQLRAGILEPLGMKDTGIDDGVEVEPGWATGYLFTPQGGVTPAEWSPTKGESVAAGSTRRRRT
jgi:CubicO group peptidase (beta-lactamase class C family)